MGLQPVTLGCTVVVTPGKAGPPDTGVIISIPQATVTANGLPLAVAGSQCLMVNSASGVPYPLTIGSAGASTGVKVEGQPLVRVLDQIPSGGGVLMIVGPPAAPWAMDQNAP